MAESDLIATILENAHAGSKLSTSLYTFSETVATASNEIKTLARDVSLTSAILAQLRQTLIEEDASDSSKLSSSNADHTAQDVLNECAAVFTDIDDVLTKATESISRRWPKKGGKVSLSLADRPKWPFLQPRMALLRGNLERLKATLVLMVNVLGYARDLREESNDAPKKNDLYQRTLLENLILANQAATTKYETLLKTIESQGEDTLLATYQTLYQDSSSEPELAPSVRHSLKHVERALLQFERSAPISYGNSRMGVHIELEKDLARSRDGRSRPSPWSLVSVMRREDTPPSYNESWIPSEGEVYGSFAGGALEGLTVDDYRDRSRSRSRVRFQETYQDSYQDRRPVQAGPSRRNNASPGEIGETVGLMHDSPRRGNRLDLESQRDPLSSGAVKFQKGARTKTWYSSLLESIPSANTAMSNFQKTVKNTGLFLGLEDEKDNPSTVLEYKNSPLASPPNSPGVKLVRSTTFDEMLRSPSSEGQLTPLSTVVSKEEVPEKRVDAETEIQAPKAVVPVGSTPIEQKIPFLVPADGEDGGGVSGRTTPEGMASPEMRSSAADGTKGEGAEGKGEINAVDGVEGSGISEKGGQGGPTVEAAEVTASKGKGKAKQITYAAEPDEIDLLLKEWTNVYE